jgi:hypothetical protein
MHSSLLCHCFDMCSLEMIRNSIKIPQWTQSRESLLNSIKSWVCCSTSNLTTSNHGMTQEVHNMYCDFILIRVTTSYSDIYHWISPILLSTNYWTLSPYIPIGMLHQDWCWVSAKNPYATCFAHSPPHKINMYFIKFRKEQWEEDDTSQHEQR